MSATIAAQEAPQPETSSETPEEEVAPNQNDLEEENSDGSSGAKPMEMAPQRTLPDSNAKHIAGLKAQYPPEDLQKIAYSGGEFTALWRQDRSGKAFGALLIVPTDGQTANWPHTIDILRTDLPKSGWSTLSIDVQTLPKARVPDRPKLEVIKQDMAESNAETQDGEANTDKNIDVSSADSDTEMRDKKESEAKSMMPSTEAAIDPNMERIEAAVNFLNEKGQYNIVLAGYGISAKRILEYAENKSTEAMGDKLGGNVNSNMQHPVRAMVIVNPKTEDSRPVAPMIESFTHKKMPILDLVVGNHYLDTLDAKVRKRNARNSNFETYVQLQMLEPRNVVFDQENRLSRRVRGFLNKYAKGVEIGK